MLLKTALVTNLVLEQSHACQSAADVNASPVKIALRTATYSSCKRALVDNTSCPATELPQSHLVPLAVDACTCRACNQLAHCFQDPLLQVWAECATVDEKVDKQVVHVCLNMAGHVTAMYSGRRS